MTSHLIKLLIEGFVKVPQLLHDIGVNVRMSPAFGFAQTVGFAVPFRSLKAWEALRWVKVEVLFIHHPPESEEVLDPSHFTCRVADESLSTHKQQLLHGEVLQPALKVLSVDTYLYSTPR